MSIQQSLAIAVAISLAVVGCGSTTPSAAELKDCIVAFNELDRKLKGFIETSERDDICTEFDLLFHACGLGGHDNLADERRDW